MILRWFLSRTVRQTTDLCHRVKKILNAQWDLLTPQARDLIQQAIEEVRTAIKSGADKKSIVALAENLETVANKWLKPYPNANIRENVDVILVALVVALGIRTFFLQPMAIPTGSMQPTLFGITPNEPTYEPNLQVPSWPVRIFDSLVHGISYYHVTAKSNGQFHLIDSEPRAVFPLVKRQRFRVGNDDYAIWFPVEGLFSGAMSRGRVPVREGQSFRKGEDIIRLRVKSGDRLFVDRVTYNFRRPSRGEIVIFQTHGISGLQQDTHYIKRLVALGGEKVRVGDDRHLVIDGVRLDASTPRFENVYSFNPKTPPQEDHYSGHVNGAVAKSIGRPDLAQRLDPRFESGATEFTVDSGRCLVMGDNTMNSYDSRWWGDFPQGKIIGKCFFVFWPISERFGWAVR